MAEDHPRPGVEYLGAGEVAKRLGVDRRTLSRWVEAGLIVPTWRTAGGGVARYYWPDVQEQVAELRRRRGE